MPRLSIAITGVAAIVAMASGVQAADAPIRSPSSITLLGTAGGPPAHADRSQPATLLQVAGRNYLIDAGENVGQQLTRAGVPARAVSELFLTHLHWDHVLGLGYLMATGWMTNRTAVLPIYGPPGTAQYVRDEVRAVAQGEAIYRAQSPDRPELASLYSPREVTVERAPVEIFKDEFVRVTAVANSHYSVIHSDPHDYGIDRSYAYRFDTADGAVVFTGDTGPSADVEKLAKGADVLVSEVCDLASIRATMLKLQAPATLDKLMQHMAQQHLSPEEVGKLAAAAGVKKVVLTHFVTGENFDPKTMIPAIRMHFKGEIVLGRDLVKVSLGSGK